MTVSGQSIVLLNTISFPDNYINVTSGDQTGFEVLQVIKKASRFNQWMFETIAPFCNGSILEIGSGTGNISSFFVERNYEITLSDINDAYVDILKKQYHNRMNVKGILDIDLQRSGFAEKYGALKEQYDTIILLNVLEHLENEDYAISNCSYFLKKGGRLIILVPAYKFLYSQLDKELGHFRRYTRKRLMDCIIRKGLSPEKGFYFNALGILAWFYGKIFSLKTIPGTEMSFFNTITPFAKAIDKILFHKAGLSVICISKK